jgi:hypothetical protein
MLVIVAAMTLAHVSSPSANNIDKMTTQQQKEWLLAHLTVDLRFDEKRIAVWEKKLDAMTPTRIAVTVKSYILAQEKKQKEEKARSQRSYSYYRYYSRSYSNHYYAPARPYYPYINYYRIPVYTIPIRIHR